MNRRIHRRYARSGRRRKWCARRSARALSIKAVAVLSVMRGRRANGVPACPLRDPGPGPAPLSGPSVRRVRGPDALLCPSMDSEREPARKFARLPARLDAVAVGVVWVSLLASGAGGCADRVIDAVRLPADGPRAL